MTPEMKTLLQKQVERLLQANSCCSELKQAAQHWQESVGTSEEAAATKALLQELKEDITSLDGLLEFCHSGGAAAVMGAEVAGQLQTQAEQAKTQGRQVCICEACDAGQVILDHEADILASL